MCGWNGTYPAASTTTVCCISRHTRGVTAASHPSPREGTRIPGEAGDGLDGRPLPPIRYSRPLVIDGREYHPGEPGALDVEPVEQRLRSTPQRRSAGSIRATIPSPLGHFGDNAPGMRLVEPVRAQDRLTPEQQESFDRIPVDVRLQPSGDQTAEQARNLAIASFRQASQFDGISVPSEAAVQNAIDAAIDACCHSPSPASDSNR